MAANLQRVSVNEVMKVKGPHYCPAELASQLKSRGTTRCLEVATEAEKDLSETHGSLYGVGHVGSRGISTMNTPLTSGSQQLGSRSSGDGHESKCRSESRLPKSFRAHSSRANMSTTPCIHLTRSTLRVLEKRFEALSHSPCFNNLEQLLAAFIQRCGPAPLPILPLALPALDFPSLPFSLGALLRLGHAA
jgi:hypothetical protein